MADAVFAPDAELRRLSASGEIRASALPAWRDWLATLEPGQAREDLFDMKVHHQGRLAIVWAPFTIAIDGDLRGCGVNTFRMGDMGEPDAPEWRVVTGMDFQAEGCKREQYKQLLLDRPQNSFLFCSMTNFVPLSRISLANNTKPGIIGLIDIVDFNGNTSECVYMSCTSDHNAFADKKNEEGAVGVIIPQTGRPYLHGNHFDWVLEIEQAIFSIDIDSRKKGASTSYKTSSPKPAKNAILLTKSGSAYFVLQEMLVNLNTLEISIGRIEYDYSMPVSHWRLITQLDGTTQIYWNNI